MSSARNRNRQAPSAPAPVATTEAPTASRRRQINVARKVERAAASAYKDAVHKAASCDPLCVDYEPAQKNLEFTAESLITAREHLQKALFGVMEAE